MSIATAFKSQALPLPDSTWSVSMGYAFMHKSSLVDLPHPTPNTHLLSEIPRSFPVSMSLDLFLSLSVFCSLDATHKWDCVTLLSPMGFRAVSPGSLHTQAFFPGCCITEVFERKQLLQRSQLDTGKLYLRITSTAVNRFFEFTLYLCVFIAINRKPSIAVRCSHADYRDSHWITARKFSAWAGSTGQLHTAPRQKSKEKARSVWAGKWHTWNGERKGEKESF